MSMTPPTIPKMCSTKASTCRQIVIRVHGSHDRDLSSLLIAMTMSGFTRSLQIGLDEQDCHQTAATHNGRKSEHHPWPTSRHLAGVVSVLSGQSIQSSGNLGHGTLPFSSTVPVLQPFGAYANHMYIRTSLSPFTQFHRSCRKASLQ